MTLDLSSLVWVFFAIMLLQPLFMGRWYTVRRAQAIRAIERSHGSRVITMIHRQEKRSLFGFAVARQIDLEDAQTIYCRDQGNTEGYAYRPRAAHARRHRAGSDADCSRG
jgi:hypothetical protein